MLEGETIQAAVLGRARRVQQRRVALPQRDSLMMNPSKGSSSR